jgi:hypothetical protein
LKEDHVNRFAKALVFALLAVACVAGFGLVTSCNIGNGGLGGTGRLNVLVTDSPTEDWAKVTVTLKSLSLHRVETGDWETVWPPDPDNPPATTINLVELNDVAQILSSVTVPVGTYNKLKIAIDTTNITLEADDGTVISSENVKVIDPSGKGEIKVDLDPDLMIKADGDNYLQVDFDLAHPLSIVYLDGKVVISFKVRHKPLPRHVQSIQFTRTLGYIQDAVADAAGVGTVIVTPLEESDITFKINAKTIYTNADTGLAGTFAELSGLIDTGAALVASNMNADGSLYARRIWYAAELDTLPQFTPEGLVRRVGDTWLSIMKKRTEENPEMRPMDGHHRHHCDWGSETVFVDGETQWTFQNVDMGVDGLEGLKYVSRGYRVEVTYPADATGYPKTADSINIQRAQTEGIVGEATTESFTLGWFWRSKTMSYSTINDTTLGDHTFGWWFYGLDSSRSTVVQDFVDVVTKAKEAKLWVFARAGLYWDAANLRWVVENLILAPMKLHDFTKIKTGYTPTVAGDPTLGTMVVSTYDCWDEATPVDWTITLDGKTEELQTIVGSFVWNAQTNLVTFSLPVKPAEWEALLTPAVHKVKIWVRPVEVNDGEFAWYAYSVIAYQFIQDQD